MARRLLPRLRGLPRGTRSYLRQISDFRLLCRRNFSTVSLHFFPHFLETLRSLQYDRYAVSFTRHLTPIPAGLPLDQAARESSVPPRFEYISLTCRCSNSLCRCHRLESDQTIQHQARRLYPHRWSWRFVIPFLPLVLHIHSDDMRFFAGGLGHLAVQYAAAMSLRVIAVDTGASKEALCRGYGAEFFIDFKTTKNLVADIKAAAGGLGPHAAILASSSGEAYNEALEYLRFVFSFLRFYFRFFVMRADDGLTIDLMELSSLLDFLPTLTSRPTSSGPSSKLSEYVSPSLPPLPRYSDCLSIALSDRRILRRKPTRRYRSSRLRRSRKSKS